MQFVAPLQLLERHRMMAVLPGDSNEGVGYRARPTGELFTMSDPRIRYHDDPGPDHLGPPTEIEIFTQGHDGRVEPTELFKKVRQEQCARYPSPAAFRPVLGRPGPRIRPDPRLQGPRPPAGSATGQEHAPLSGSGTR